MAQANSMQWNNAKDDAVGDEANDCEFLFAAFAKKHNAVIRKIREISPLEWDGEFLELKPQVLRFLGTFNKRYPECAAFKTAYTLASALARLSPRIPQAAISRHATGRATDEPTDPRQELQTGDRQRAQEQIQQQQKQNINSFRPQMGSCPRSIDQ